MNTKQHTMYGDDEPRTVFKQFDPIPIIREFSNFDIIEEISRRGTEVRYKAQEKRSGKYVAITLLLTKEKTKEGSLRDFQDGARKTMQLNHPNIIKTHSVGVVKGNYYVITDYVHGETLQEKMVRETIPVDEACTIMIHVLKGLEYAHRRSVYHLDLKPSNIVLRRDSDVTIINFGLAAHVDSHTRRKMTGTVWGTPSYIAPEQTSGKNHDAGYEADIYSVGVILYEMISGSRFLIDDSPLGIMRRFLRRGPRPLKTFRPGIEDDCSRIVMKCLKRNPKNRYGSARELREDLQAFLSDKPVTADKKINLTHLLEKCKPYQLPIAFALIIFVNILLVYIAIGIRDIVRLSTHTQQQTFPVNAWRPIISEEVSGEGQWFGTFSSLWEWKRELQELQGNVPLVLPIRNTSYAEIRMGLTTTGETLSIDAGFDRSALKGCRIQFNFSRHRTPDDISGVEIYVDTEKRAQNYSCALQPETFYRIRITLEHRELRVSINGRECSTLTGLFRLNNPEGLFVIDPEEGNVRMNALHAAVKEKSGPMLQGDHQYAAGNYEKARKLYVSTSQHSPLSHQIPESLCKSGICSIHMGEYGKALETFSRLISEKYTQDTTPWTLYGSYYSWLCAVRMGKEEACTRYERTIPESYYNMEINKHIPHNVRSEIISRCLSRERAQTTDETKFLTREHTADTARLMHMPYTGYSILQELTHALITNAKYEDAIRITKKIVAEYSIFPHKSAWAQLTNGHIHRMMNNIPMALREYAKTSILFPEMLYHHEWAEIWRTEAEITGSSLPYVQREKPYACPLPAQAYQMLTEGKGGHTMSDIPSIFKNDMLYLQAVCMRKKGKKKEALSLLREALLSGKGNEWPEILITRSMESWLESEGKAVDDQKR